MPSTVLAAHLIAAKDFLDCFNLLGICLDKLLWELYVLTLEPYCLQFPALFLYMKNLKQLIFLKQLFVDLAGRWPGLFK